MTELHPRIMKIPLDPPEGVKLFRDRRPGGEILPKL
jgi:hypothetical protein